MANSKLNRLYFNANLGESDIESLSASLMRLVEVEKIAARHNVETTSELEDYDRIITLFVPTGKLVPLCADLSTSTVLPTSLDIYDPAAQRIGETLGLNINDMVEEFS